MPIQITKRHEPIEVTRWVAMIYGQPGAGKTSTAFTSASPLLLDFDAGSHRSEFRKDVVMIESWADIAGITADDLKPYETLVVDTVGRLLDHLAFDIIQKNGKMGTKAGGLTLQGYGALKSQFAQWVKTTQLMGVNILFIAHEKEERQGDEVKIRPDIQGGSFGEVFKIADQVGYLHIDHNNQKVIDFEPTDYWYGKNTGGFDTVSVPNFHTTPDFFAELSQELLDRMNASSKESQDFADEVEKNREQIEGMNEPIDLTAHVAEVAKMDDGPLKTIVKNLVSAQAKALGLKWNTETNGFMIKSDESTETNESE